MSTMTSTVNISSAAIKELSRAAIMALEQTGEALHTEVEQAQVVPRRDGYLQGSKFYLDKTQSALGKVSLMHEGPYARRLYYHPEYNFRHDANPNAKGKWFEDWESGGANEDFIPRFFAQKYKELNGG